jgi:2-polyprenyl-6-methoxyphenol hydroxylase-like FAD-dependent oxidoreductase
MRVAVIGAGPAGLLTGAALARRGHHVVAVDRDAGPDHDGTWLRRGVMQFHHAHAFRGQVSQALQQEWPEAYDAWRARGAEPIVMTLPDGTGVPGGMRSRRATFERSLRDAAPDVDRLDVRRGHVEGVTRSAGRATGIQVDGAVIEADLVIDASGRSGRATNAIRPLSSVGGPCGMAYVDREYRLRDGQEPGPMLNPLAWQADFDGYQTIVFLHERGYFSVLLVRPTADHDLKDLRFTDAFESACRAIPGLAEWTDPARAEPVDDVQPGGPLRNVYRGQLGRDGTVALPGLVAVGDAVATTTPTFGRGVATTYLQVMEFLRLFDEGLDPESLGEAFDAWCEQQMLPWVVDHVHMDGDTARRWRGGDIDLTQRIPSDRIMAAVEVDARIAPAIGGYLSMTALPRSLDPVEPLARAVYASGWRPAYAPGPTRDELVALVRETRAGTEPVPAQRPGSVLG